MPSAELEQVMALMEDLMQDWMPAAWPDPDIPRLRELMPRAASLGRVPESVSVQPVSVGGRPAEWLTGNDSDPARRLLYLHGGSYLFGDLDSSRALAAQIARASGAAVLNLDYRLAPEHPFDAPCDDACAALKFLRDQGPQGAAPAARLFAAGDSAGGGLALAATQQLLEAGAPSPDALILLSPALDLSDHSGFPPEARPMVECHTRLFLGDVDPAHPIASPLHGRLRGLPPILIQASAQEPALANCQKFANMARAAGANVDLATWEAMPHVWQMYAPLLPEAVEAIAALGAYIRSH